MGVPWDGAALAGAAPLTTRHALLGPIKWPPRPPPHLCAGSTSTGIRFLILSGS